VPSRELGLLDLGVSTRKKIGTDHLETITPRFITSQHQSSRIDGFLDYGHLALVKLEVDNLPGFRLLPREVPFDLALKSLLRQSLSLVQPRLHNRSFLRPSSLP
jgi:hypothetical protein